VSGDVQPGRGVGSMRLTLLTAVVVILLDLVLLALLLLDLLVRLLM